MTSKPSKTARTSTRAARKTVTPTSKRTKAAKPTKRKAAATPPPAPTGTKQSQLLAMLCSPDGGTIAQMTALTGWQPHTVRGTISGVLRKRLQLNVVLDPGTRVYRIVEAASLSALAELTSLDRAALAERWTEAFSVPAPKSCQATLLRQALAWHIQMQALQARSGIRETRRGKTALKQAPMASPTLSPGTRLLREWQGRTHHVTVVAEGFAYDNRVWPSLSAIARAITGTRWSGPAFFGLRS